LPLEKGDPRLRMNRKRESRGGDRAIDGLVIANQTAMQRGNLAMASEVVPEVKILGHHLGVDYDPSLMGGCFSGECGGEDEEPSHFSPPPSTRASSQ